MGCSNVVGIVLFVSLLSIANSWDYPETVPEKDVGLYLNNFFSFDVIEEVIAPEDSVASSKDEEDELVINRGYLEITDLFSSNEILNTIEVVEEDSVATPEKKTSVNSPESDNGDIIGYPQVNHNNTNDVPEATPTISSTTPPRTTTLPDDYHSTWQMFINGQHANADPRLQGIKPVDSVDPMLIEYEIGRQFHPALNDKDNSTKVQITGVNNVIGSGPLFPLDNLILEDKGSGYHPTLETEHSSVETDEDFNGYGGNYMINKGTIDIPTRRIVKLCPINYVLHGDKCEKLCGYPLFSNASKCMVLLPHQTLRECSNTSKLTWLVFAFIVLGIVIIFGNALVPFLIYKNKELRSRHNYIKVSLAFADMLIGFLLVCSVVPSIYSVLNATSGDLNERIFHSENSPGSIIGGSILTLSAQASVMHLLFLSVERLIAIRWPLWHRTRKTSTLFGTIAGVWIWSVMVSLVPAMIRQHFAYSFSQVLFTPILYSKSSGKGLNIYGIIYGFVTIILPYILTTICILTTGVTVWKKVKLSTHMQATSVLGQSRKRRTRNGENMTGTDFVNRMRLRQKIKPDVVVFKTTIIMIVAFTLTILPFTVVVIMFLAGELNCENHSVPSTVCFLASMSNSFINVLIYSIRDRNFRKSFRRTFAPASVQNYADMWRTVTRKISNNNSGSSAGTASTYIPDHGENP